MQRDISRRDIVVDRAAYAEIRPRLRAEVIPLRALRRVPLGDAFALAFENATTLRYQVQEMLMVEAVTDEAAVTHEIEAYSRLLPSTHSLVATLFFEHDDIRTVKDELLRLTGAQHAIRLDVGGAATDLPPPHRVPGVEIPGVDESGPSTLTQAVHFLRFTLDDVSRAAFCDPDVPVTAVIDHPEYSAATPVTGDVRASLIADLAGVAGPADGTRP